MKKEYTVTRRIVPAGDSPITQYRKLVIMRRLWFTIQTMIETTNPEILKLQ